MKTDFTPVEGGHYHGRTFKKHILRGQSIFPIAVLFGMFLAILLQPSEFEDQMGWYYGVLGALASIGYFVWWRLFVISHWKTLKANGIRTEKILEEQRLTKPNLDKIKDVDKHIDDIR